MLVLVGVAAVVGVTAFAGWRLLSYPPCFNRADYERIREGMTEAEVEAVLGVPPGNYCSDYYGRYTIWDQVEAHYTDTTICDGRKWFSDTGFVVVYFRAPGAVVAKSFSEVRFHGEVRWSWGVLRQRLGW
jgi:hypothetical protein